jgi:hypothetical protein
MRKGGTGVDQHQHQVHGMANTAVRLEMDAESRKMLLMNVAKVMMIVGQLKHLHVRLVTNCVQNVEPAPAYYVIVQQTLIAGGADGVNWLKE